MASTSAKLLDLELTKYFGTQMLKRIKKYIEQKSDFTLVTEADIDEMVQEIVSDVFPSVTIAGDSTVAIGSTVTLEATTVPSGQTVVWESSNTDVATVADGVVTGVAEGYATITASFDKDGETITGKKVIDVTAS